MDPTEFSVETTPLINEPYHMIYPIHFVGDCKVKLEKLCAMVCCL